MNVVNRNKREFDERRSNGVTECGYSLTELLGLSLGVVANGSRSQDAEESTTGLIRMPGGDRGVEGTQEDVNRFQDQKLANKGRSPDELTSPNPDNFWLLYCVIG